MNRAQSSSRQPLSPSQALLFAVAGAIVVGNLYWAQPLLGAIAADLGVSTSTAGLLITSTQIGYAVGIFFTVPLGDAMSRHRLIPVVVTLSSLALLTSALAPGFVFLAAGLAAVGLSSITNQMLVPLVADLAPAPRAGRMIGTVTSGVLIGILSARVTSGLIAELAGWRVVFAVAAVANLTVAVLMARVIPPLPPRVQASYPSLLASVVTTTWSHRAARRMLVFNGFMFATFNLFWTAMTFLLSSTPYGWSTSAIGLVSLVGIVGALSAQRIARLEDIGHGVTGIGASMGIALLGLVITVIGAHQPVVLLCGAAIVNLGVQGAGVLTQTRLMALAPKARSRLNTGYVTSNFVFGAVGSGIVATLWGVGGWTAVIGAGMLSVVCALATWALSRRVLETAVGGSH